jgi:hypothetical protein
MPTLEDFQNILQSAQQEKVVQSPLYQKVVKESMMQQQVQADTPPEVQAVFDELKGMQERNQVREKLQRYNNAVQDAVEYYATGGNIHISPSKKGTFTAAASRHGMGVQEFASKVLANKDNYSPAMVKKANFARNASHWHDYGGPINCFANGGKSNNEQLWNRARPLYNELTAAGVPHMAAIGVLGNIALESSVNPNASNKVNGGHWGYTQNDKAITNHIKKYYGGYGHKEQMQFLKDGLTGQIRGAKQAPWLQKRFDEYKQSVGHLNDPAKAALMWEKYYEKSANEAIDKRADYAKYFHDALGSPDYQYSPDRYNGRAGLGPLVGETTEQEAPQEAAPWYNQYQLNDNDYAELYEQSNAQLPMLDPMLAWNPMQPQQEGTYPNLFAGGGYIEDGLRSLGVNGFRVTSGYRGPNSKVGKAGKRSGHAHTLKDGSSGAIDIVPTDKSPAGWARLEQQLRQPEVQQFLASFGGTILDERDAATMKKTGATGQHFHIGLGVKGGGNFYNQPASQYEYAQRSPVSVFSPIQSSTVQENPYTPWYAQGSRMTDEDWAALYNQSGGTAALDIPAPLFGNEESRTITFPALV